MFVNDMKMKYVQKKNGFRVAASSHDLGRSHLLTCHHQHKLFGQLCKMMLVSKGTQLGMRPQLDPQDAQVECANTPLPNIPCY